MAYNYVNSRIILDRLLSNPLLSDLTLEDLISHTVDFLRIVGIPDFFEEKNEEFIVENNRVLLPKYFYEVNQIVDNNGTIDLATSTFHYDTTNNNSNKKFFIRSGYIHFNFKSGNIKMSYQSLPVDEDDIPMIPDNSDFTRALLAYIKVQKYTVLFDTGKLNQAVLQLAQRDYAFAVGACETEFQRMNIPSMEEFRKMNNKVFVDRNQYNKKFNNLGN